MSSAQMLSDTGLHSVQQELKVFFLPLPYLSVFNVLSLAFLLEALWFLGLLLHLSSSPLQTAHFPIHCLLWAPSPAIQNLVILCISF